MKLKKLPIGIDDFEKIRKEDFFYIDKTGMIKELLENWGEVNLFTRPRRFGKTLNMSMLKSFFEIGTDKSLFHGLAIEKEKELCEKYMGQFPVISLSLKQVKGNDYENAKEQMWSVIKREATRLKKLIQESTILDEDDKQDILNLSRGIGNIYESILAMTSILYKEYNKKVIVLIDEYDVPLQKANTKGYYKDMAELISQLFGYSLKSNTNMQFAVVTGCLRVTKESIFTGFNNPKMHTIIDTRYDEWFGFTEEEVKEVLQYYNKEDYYDITKEWYDGYLFGSVNVYNPWDVINWCEELTKNSDNLNHYLEPELYWVNSSENEIIRHLADMADDETREDLESLLRGESVIKKMNLQLTYNEIYNSINNVWNVLFMTGYLTYKERRKNGFFELVIPNKEIMMIIKTQIREWFDEKVKNDTENLTDFFMAIDNDDSEEIERCMNAALDASISYMDGGQLDIKENFYHGFLLGILNTRKGWITKSNREAGDGRLDIATYPKKCEYAVIFELKYAKTEKEDLYLLAQEALNQIKRERYDNYFIHLKPKKIVHYGIAFHKKYCCVLMEKEN